MQFWMIRVEAEMRNVPGDGMSCRGAGIMVIAEAEDDLSWAEAGIRSRPTERQTARQRIANSLNGKMLGTRIPTNLHEK